MDLRPPGETALEGVLAALEASSAPAAFAPLCDAAERLSDELRAAGEHFGYDTDIAWDLLAMRERLDSHLVAASALAAPDTPSDRAVELVQRGVRRVADSLRRLRVGPAL